MARGVAWMKTEASMCRHPAEAARDVIKEAMLIG
jgi:hypothetical protein